MDSAHFDLIYQDLFKDNQDTKKTQEVKQKEKVAEKIED